MTARRARSRCAALLFAAVAERLVEAHEIMENSGTIARAAAGFPLFLTRMVLV